MDRDLAGPGLTVADALTAVAGVCPRSRWSTAGSPTGGCGWPTPWPTTPPRAVLCWAAGSPQSPPWTCAWSACSCTATACRSRVPPAPPPWATRPVRRLGGRKVGQPRRGSGPGRHRAGRAAAPLVPVRPGDAFLAEFAHSDRSRHSSATEVRPRDRPQEMADALIAARTAALPDPALHPQEPLPRRRDGVQGAGARRRAPAAAGEQPHRYEARADQQGQAPRPRHPRTGLRPAHVGHGRCRRGTPVPRRPHPPPGRAGDRLSRRARHRGADDGRRRARGDRGGAPRHRGGGLALREAFRLPDSVADNAGAARVVLGNRGPPSRGTGGPRAARLRLPLPRRRSTPRPAAR